MARLVLLLSGLAACSYTPPGIADDTDDAPPACAVPPCDRLVPSNRPSTDELDDPDLPDLRISHGSDTGAFTTWRIYTDDGLIEEEVEQDVLRTYRGAGLGVDVQTRLRFEHLDPNLAVLYVRRFEVRRNARFEGYGTRALIVLARDRVELEDGSEIDFSAGFIAPGAPDNTVDFRPGGPGGGHGGISSAEVAQNGAGGCGPGGAGALRAGGGGGGGGSPGAKGGDSQGLLGGMAGAACLPVDLVPLAGGGGGGAADVGAGGGNGGAGGGGGGAIQLTSLSEITIAGIIDVGGKGGQGEVGNDRGGGGGGAGGGILLEAPSVTLAASAVLAANGGGGGSGRVANRGTQGSLDTLPAPGGAGSGGSGQDGRGGDGGANNILPTAGDDHDPGGGGGGGGFGVVRINTDPGRLANAEATISPIPSTGTTRYQPR
jgi:hypothetical protein